MRPDATHKSIKNKESIRIAKYKDQIEIVKYKELRQD
jgi:hypothetical protein